jgi:Sulfatase-modifying factor enzyme 1
LPRGRPARDPGGDNRSSRGDEEIGAQVPHDRRGTRVVPDKGKGRWSQEKRNRFMDVKTKVHGRVDASDSGVEAPTRHQAGSTLGRTLTAGARMKDAVQWERLRGTMARHEQAAGSPGRAGVVGLAGVLAASGRAPVIGAHWDGYSSDGAPVCVVPATDCMAAGNACVEAGCQDGACAERSAPEGTPCAEGGGGLCNGRGTCIVTCGIPDGVAPTPTSCQPDGRLPTAAEWNYAAAGGSEQRLYPWGSTEVDYTHASYACADTEADCGPTGVRPVGSSPKGNGYFGHADLAGNLREWTLDAAGDSDLYGVPCLDCANLAASDQRAIRGGSFSNDTSAMRVSDRRKDEPDVAEDNYGIRCARAP